MLNILDGQSHDLEPLNSQLVNKKSTRSFKDDATRESASSLVSGLLANDPIFKRLYVKDDEGNLNSNPVINAFRTEAENELIKLLEIVLLKHYGDTFKKNHASLLQDRLSAMIKPHGWGDKSKDLPIVDRYLIEQASHEALKEAFELIRPYFAQMMRPRIEDEARTYLHETLDFKSINHII